MRTRMPGEKYYQSPKDLGNDFEKRVMKAFERINYVLVQKNQWNRNYALDKDKASKREYDLVMFNTADCQFYIIECKAHYNKDKQVGVEQLKEFNHKLKNYNGKSTRQVLATDTSFTNRAINYAMKNKIMLIDGKELKRMEASGSLFNQIGMRVIRSGISSGLERILGLCQNNYSKQTGGG